MSGIIFLKKLAAVSITGLCGIAGFACCYLPHTLFKKQYYYVQQLLHKDNLQVWHTPEFVNKLKDEVMKDMNCSTEEILATTVFTSPSSKLIHIGTFHNNIFNNSGAYIGVPVTFHINSKYDLNEISYQFKEKNLVWTSAVGEEIIEALLLSDSARKFALARELVYLKSNKLILEGSLWGGTFASMALSYFPIRLFSIRRQFHMITRLSMIVSACGYCFLAGLFVSDWLTCYYENYIDKTVSNLGSDYISGGIEFYKKVLRKNTALRNLSVKGDSVFTVYGNEVMGLREKHVKITTRLKNMHSFANETNTTLS